MQNRRILITGCSGGGKSSLLAVLAERGYRTVQEPGRRIVKQELADQGQNLPWINMKGFAHSALALAKADLRSWSGYDELVFFDRGAIDAAAALAVVTGRDVEEFLTDEDRYDHLVFLAPPWAEIYKADDERRHNFQEAMAEYRQLERVVPKLGYKVALLPKLSVRERVDFVMRQLTATNLS